MKQVYRKLCTYSSDLFGINSALYELGGLIVMHDASGCNSTYNTHDEPRWYSMDSMVYVSGLTERDAILGNDERLIGDVVDVALREKPKFIALSRSVLPAYLGTDLCGIARVIEKRTGIPSFGFMTNGMDSYVCGATEAYLAIARRFCRAPEAVEAAETAGQPEASEAVEAADQPGSPRIAVAVLGVTPLDFSVNGNVEALEEFLRDCGFQLQSCWSMGSSLEELAGTPSADVTLVVSATGLPAAQYLYEQYGVPWVLGIPTGRAASRWIAELLHLAAETGKPQSLFEEAESEKPQSFFEEVETGKPQSLFEEAGSGHPQSHLEEAENGQPGEVPSGEMDDRRVVLVGEAIHCASLRYCLRHEYGIRNVVVNCPLEQDAGVLGSGDLHLQQEDDIAELLSHTDIVIADPVYRRVTPEGVLFLDDPHEAYSGRMYHDRGRRFCGADADIFPELRR